MFSNMLTVLRAIPEGGEVALLVCIVYRRRNFEGLDNFLFAVFEILTFRRTFNVDGRSLSNRQELCRLTFAIAFQNFSHESVWIV